MTTPPFVFNHRTGDVTKDGIVAPLSGLQAKIFGALALATANGVPIGIGAIAKAVGEQVYDVEDELPSLIHLLKKLGIHIAHERGRGRWLTFEPPPKFEVKIPPPYRLEGEAP